MASPLSPRAPPFRFQAVFPAEGKDNPAEEEPGQGKGREASGREEKEAGGQTSGVRWMKGEQGKARGERMPWCTSGEKRDDEGGGGQII